MRTISIETQTMGQSFGTCAVLRDARTGRKLAVTGVRPYGFTAAAIDDARAIVAEKGWREAPNDDE